MIPISVLQSVNALYSISNLSLQLLLSVTRILFAVLEFKYISIETFTAMLTISIYSTVKIFLFEHIFIVCKQRAKADSTALHCLLDGVSENSSYLRLLTFIKIPFLGASYESPII